MVARSVEINKDAWLLQAYGGTTKYGQGDGNQVHVGRVPSGNANPDWKSRSVFEVVLRNGVGTGVLDGATAVTAATIDLTVAGSSCIVGGRGTVFYAFLEEVTSDFNEKPMPTTDCSFSSGSGSGVWPGPASTTTNRAYISAPGLAGGDVVSWNVTAMLQAKLADTSADLLRFRLIYATSDGTGYDESVNPPRATAFWSASTANPNSDRPVLNVTVSTGSLDKVSSDLFTFVEVEDVIASGTGTVASNDQFVFNDDLLLAGPVPVWTTAVDSAGAGHGTLTLAAANAFSSVLLDDVDETDIVVRCKFSINKIPNAQSVVWWLLSRTADARTFYTAKATCRNNGSAQAGINVSLHAYVNGVETALLALVSNARPLIKNTDYWLEFLVQGTSPTTLAARIWSDSETRPTAYQVTQQDSTAGLQVSGTVGMRGSVASGVSNLPIVFSFDDFVGVAP